MNDSVQQVQYGKLWVKHENVLYPICVNNDGYLQVIFGDVEGETFTITMLSHPSIGGETAFEFRTASGRQVTGAGGNVLREAQRELAVPGPACRILHQDVAGEGNLHWVRLQTLDTRFITLYEQVAISERKVKPWSGWSLHPYENVTRYEPRATDLLRMAEPGDLPPSDFLLQWVEEPTG
ncbi:MULTISPECIES: hypothetical protein [unclassified Pseudomonas]|uniref:hypothetical protein n=1 Tax=unclassified Pseudomonas TaxID=196821 RepID=UPI0035C1CC72